MVPWSIIRFLVKMSGRRVNNLPYGLIGSVGSVMGFGPYLSDLLDIPYRKNARTEPTG